tara:strand:+ start:386 stop:1198 length:813 start_codon:yes stop_codon:yes gene_type:complete
MFYKLKIINRKNFLYVYFKILYSLFNLSLFYSLMVVFYPKNKNIFSKISFFLKKISSITRNNLKIENKNILELGGGNLFGLFPYFLKKKCKLFTNLDPYVDVNPANLFLTKFFFKRKTKNFLSIKDTDFKIYKHVKDINKIKDMFDIVVSLSCLEHVKNLDNTFTKLKFITKKNHKQFHIINFSSHLNKIHPFKDLYEIHPKEFKKKYNNNINFLRISDYTKLLDKKKYSFTVKILDTSPINKIKLHRYWKKYSIDELQIRTVLLKVSKN